MTLNVIPRPNKTEFYGGEISCAELPVEYLTDESFGEEKYVLDIQKNKVTVISKGEKGRFYAEKTYMKLAESGTLPLCRITDEPEFSYRGFMIDSARHMQTVDEIKKYISAAAEFKFNIFHWHLCDDQGWRIESESFPELLTKGAYRDCHGFKSHNASRYGGYYTKAEIREIVDFCKENFIEVIPEIDVPGHTTAIISTYPELSCRGEQIPVATDGGIFKDILCPGNQEVYDFCYRLFDEVCELFPGEYFHIGGDEAPKARWCSCEKCQATIKREGLKDVEELQGYFTNKIMTYLENEKGKKVICWNEALNSGLVKDSVIIANWMDRADKCAAYANKGGKIIAEDFYHYYLDYPYGMTPLKKTYGYSPYVNKLTATGKSNTIGVETPIWTENVKDFDRMCYMCFPRLIACGESGWTKEDNKCYKSFKERLLSYEGKLLSIGIRMADESEWDPSPWTRTKDIVNRWISCLNPQAISVFLFPNRDEKKGK